MALSCGLLRQAWTDDGGERYAESGEEKESYVYLHPSIHPTHSHFYVIWFPHTHARTFAQ